VALQLSLPARGVELREHSQALVFMIRGGHQQNIIFTNRGTEASQRLILMYGGAAAL
jgi:hypothetical protein